MASTQDLLRNVGHDPGASDGKDGPKTQAAVKAFQKQKGLGETGQADAGTRKALYTAFMDDCNPLKLAAKDFDAIDGKPHAGCSEFNRFEDTQGACAANRRVTVVLLKATKNFPIQYPCKHGDIGPCKAHVARKGDRRTKDFGCFFYDKLIKEAAGPAPKPAKEGKAWFQPHAEHPFGFDKHEKYEAEDQNGTAMDCKGDPELDYLSVESGKTGLVELRYEVVGGKEIFFKVENGDSATINVKDSSASPLILEVVASKAEKAFLETKIQARQDSPDGPLLSALGLVVLKPKSYAATYFRIEDPANPDTKLTTALTVAELNAEMNKLYRAGVAKWEIRGKDKVTGISYDLIKNGSLDLEPGEDSKELTKIKNSLPKKGINIIHVHDLRWSFFLAKSAKADDTVLTLKDYGESLDFIGTNSYNIEDGAGNSVAIEVASVDKAKCKITLSAPIGAEFKLADSPALIWPFGGLSGNPTLISDVGAQEDLIIYAAHELGHTLADFFDLVEKENIMYGGPSTGKGLRHRPIPRYYYPDQNEEQWKYMRK